MIIASLQFKLAGKTTTEKSDEAKLFYVIVLQFDALTSQPIHLLISVQQS